MFAVFTSTNIAVRQKKTKNKKNKTKHGNEKLQRASWYLHQIVKNSIHKYSMYQIS